MNIQALAAHSGYCNMLTEKVILRIGCQKVKDINQLILMMGGRGKGATEERYRTQQEGGRERRGVEGAWEAGKDGWERVKVNKSA